jgi:hypothetical protein
VVVGGQQPRLSPRVETAEVVNHGRPADKCHVSTTDLAAKGRDRP